MTIHAMQHGIAWVSAQLRVEGAPLSKAIRSSSQPATEAMTSALFFRRKAAGPGMSWSDLPVAAVGAAIQQRGQVYNDLCPFETFNKLFELGEIYFDIQNPDPNAFDDLVDVPIPLGLGYPSVSFGLPRSPNGRYDLQGLRQCNSKHSIPRRCRLGTPGQCFSQSSNCAPCCRSPPKQLHA